MRDVVVVANLHPGIIAHIETTVDALGRPLMDLHWVAMRNDAVSCYTWYASSLQKFRQKRGVSPAQALSMAKRHFVGAKPELSLTACNLSCVKFHVHRCTHESPSLL